MKRFLRIISMLLVLAFILAPCSAFAANESGSSQGYDYELPRVMDIAGLFTEDELAQMEALIQAIIPWSQKDIVIYTDVTDYGLGIEVAAAGFYDYLGYGYGSDHEGMCLFINMDPEDRGGWCCCTGPETMALYTESIANAMDDVLYEYLGNGDYAQGVYDWIYNVGVLYATGYPFPPEWFPFIGDQLPQNKAANAPYVIDETGILSEADANELNSRAKALSEKLGYDVIILYTFESPGMPDYVLLENFYKAFAYGTGENHKGVLYGLFPDTGLTWLNAYGGAPNRLSENNLDRIENRGIKYLVKSDYYGAANSFLKDLEHMERTGRVPQDTSYWIVNAGIAILLGCLVGAITLTKAKKRMDTVQIAADANDYVDRNHRHFYVVSDTYLNTTTHREYIPPETRSSSGSSSSSSGRSSYSSSYSGSSGRSHSGSGRKF